MSRPTRLQVMQLIAELRDYSEGPGTADLCTRAADMLIDLQMAYDLKGWSVRPQRYDANNLCGPVPAADGEYILWEDVKHLFGDPDTGGGRTAPVHPACASCGVVHESWAPCPTTGSTGGKA